MLKVCSNHSIVQYVDYMRGAQQRGWARSGRSVCTLQDPLLSTSNVLRRFVELLDPIIDYLEEIKKPYPQLENDDWIQDLMFFTDIMQHLNTLYLALQGKNKLVSDLSQTVFGFQNKIIIFQTI